MITINLLLLLLLIIIIAVQLLLLIIMIIIILIITLLIPGFDFPVSYPSPATAASYLVSYPRTSMVWYLVPYKSSSGGQ